MKMKVLMSSCLLGEPVRYDGKGGTIDSELLSVLQRCCQVIPFCPEVEGGMVVPRPPAEIIGDGGASVLTGSGRVVTNNGDDVTEPFIRGAGKTLAKCLDKEVVAAVLKERSPSCGSRQIYDGSFSGIKTSGQGVTSALLTREGIPLFNEDQLEELLDLLRRNGNR